MTAGPPPPRPSTARLSAPPVAARREAPRPRVVALSYWLWWVAALVAVVTVVLALTRIDAMQDELARIARESDPDATDDTVDRVVDLSVLVIIGGGILLGVVGAVLAVGMRAGRGWARVTLIALTLLAVAYALLVVSATGGLVLGYAAVTVVAAVCMYLPGGKRWFG
ncbi:hypothetical protein [Actinophytocola oryzae]|uniref:Uncharacterized protein n=1 Tax=Actinophytocola oryzae TaxID=502181 RepID=A0A4R7VF04_9PSEU|nr:hypothetical protein [Actinophytocola oryzae]TDV47792.1 hypothetical protein CLV71_10927 [Actinophytocola oryzae]